MAHPETPEAVDAPTSYDEAGAAAALFDVLGDEGEPDEENPADETAEADDGPELEIEDEQDDEEAEPEDPAIGAPASLNAEEKKVFAQLPPEAQQAWAASETRRNAQVQDATTKASQAQRAHETAAAQADATAAIRYSQQLATFAQALEPTPPNPVLADSDPAAYVRELANFNLLKAQHEELVQHVGGIAINARNAISTADVQERVSGLLTHPKLANPETRESYIADIKEVAGALGYDSAAIEQYADIADFRALDTVAEWKAKADKFDKAIARQMQKVRASKGKTTRPNAAQPEGSGSRRAFTESTQRLQRTGSVQDAAAALRNIL